MSDEAPGTQQRGRDRREAGAATSGSRAVGSIVGAGLAGAIGSLGLGTVRAVALGTVGLGAVGLGAVGLGAIASPARAQLHPDARQQPGRPAAPANVPGPSPLCRHDLDRAIATVLERPDLSRTRWGLLVESLDGSQTFYRREPEQFFIPASTAKLLTTAAALEYLPPTFRIVTAAHAIDAPAADAETGRLGELVVQPQGDPTLTGDRLRELVAQLQAAGVRRVDRLVVQDGAFAGSPIDNNWEWEDAVAGYGAPVRGAILNGNAVRLAIEPSRVGLPPVLRWSDPLAGNQWILDNRALTLEPAAATDPTGGLAARLPFSGRAEPLPPLTYYRDGAQTAIVVTGAIATEAEPKQFWLAIPDPARYFADALQAALAEAGIVVDEALAIAEADRFPRGRRVAALTSPPLAELVTVANRDSDNLYAEVLFRWLSAVVFTYESRSFTTVLADPAEPNVSRARLRAALSAIGVDPTTYRMDDGSGLSRHNLTSPRALVQTLQGMARSPRFSDFRDSLPLAGESGTLASRFQSSPLRGQLRAKTGTMTGVSALAGYLPHPEFGPLAFAILANQSEQPASILRAAQDEILDAIYQMESCGEGER